MKRVLLSLALFGIFGTVAAQNLRVVFVDGGVSQARGTGWVGLALDDSLSADAVIRLEKDGYVEISGSGVRLALSRAGIYQLNAILAKRRGMDAGGLGAMLTRVAGTLSSGPAANAATAAGVRGEAQEGGAGPEWVTSDTTMYLDAAKAYISAGSYELAVEQLKEGLAAASPEELPEIRFYLAEASALDGRTREALLWLKEAEPRGGEEWAGDFWLLRAKLLVDTMAYDEAVALLEGKAAGQAASARREGLYRVTLAAAYRGTGNAAGEREQLRRLVAMGPDTELGKAAAAILAAGGQ